MRSRRPRSTTGGAAPNGASSPSPYGFWLPHARKGAGAVPPKKLLRNFEKLDALPPRSPRGRVARMQPMPTKAPNPAMITLAEGHKEKQAKRLEARRGFATFAASPKIHWEAKMPDVDPIEETVNMMSAARSFEANATVFGTAKEIAKVSLSLGDA